MASTSSCSGQNIVSATADDVEDNFYIANDGVSYRIPVGAIEIKDGTLLRVDDSTVLRLSVVPDIEESEDSLPNNDYKRTENGKGRWPESACKLLISKYKEYKPLVEERKIKTMKKFQQVESKWKTVERSFKNTMLNNKKTGRARKRCAHESELAEFLLCYGRNTKHTRHQIVTRSKIELNQSADEHSDVSARATPESNVTGITPVKAKIRNKEIQLLAEAIQNRTVAKKAAEDKNYEQRERLLQQIEVKNKLLEQILSKLSK